MPIYEYECAQCGRIEEVIQKFSDKPLKKCSHCTGKLHRLISQSAFHLKGSGWYADGYAAPPQKKAEKTQEKKQAPPASDKPEKAAKAAPQKTD